MAPIRSSELLYQLISISWSMNRVLRLPSAGRRHIRCNGTPAPRATPDSIRALRLSSVTSAITKAALRIFLYYCFLSMLSGQIPPLHACHVGYPFDHGYQGITLRSISEQRRSKK